MAATKMEHGVSPMLAGGIAIGGVVAALLIGRRWGPGPDHPKTSRWYGRLAKPSYTPPSPAYPMAWAGIQAALAYSGYRVLRAEASPERTAGVALWTATQAGIGGWSGVFFGQRAPGWGTVASATLGVGAAGYVAAAAKIDRVAGALGAPLVAWVGFATLLSEEIWRRNQPAPA